MDQPDNLIAEMRAHRVREQKKKLLLADAKNRRLRVAAILSEWARKTMAEFDPATDQRPSEEQEQHNALAAEEIQPQGSREPDHGNMKALDENRAGA